MANPKISVIMSVYNGLPHLTGAVESVLGQTFENFEFIIIDDASTDDSWKYLKSLKDKRIRLLKNNTNRGLAASLNTTLKVTKGDYVARMDADDISLPKRFETQLKFLQSHPEVDLCGTWVDLINTNNKIVGEKKYPLSDLEIKNALKWYQPIVHPTFMASSNFYKQLGGYNEHFDYAEDYELLARAMKKYHLANIPKKLLLWRLADDRRSRKSMKRMDNADFRVKLKILKSNYFGKSYISYVAKKFITAFLLPTSLKVFIAKKLKLA